MEFVKTKELVLALGLTKPTILAQAKKQGWPCVKKGNAIVFIESKLPTDVRFAVTAFRMGQTPVNGTKKEIAINDNHPILQAGEKAQETAQYRTALIFEFKQSGSRVQEFIEAYNEHGAFPLLFKQLGPVSQATFYRWLSAWKKDGASGVIPRYGMGRGGAGESLSDEERDLLRHFWLRDTQPSAMHAYRLMKANIPYSTCTYDTALRFLQSIPKATAGLYRLGSSRFENLFLPHMEQDLSRYRSLDVVVSDHHCLDCVVMYRGQLIRPWLTTFQDLRSGKILGYCPCVKPSSLSIVVAFYMACIRYGIPVSLLFDNGKDYRSKFLNGHTETVSVMTPDKTTEEVEVEFQGIFSMLGCDVHFTRTYNGKSKARQERYFRIIGEYFAKDLGTYVGSDSRSRPEDSQLMWRAINGKQQRHDVPEWMEFVNKVCATIELINDTYECTGAYMDGKTRSQVFQENLPQEVRQASKEVLQKILVKGTVRKVGRNGVKVGGVNFYHSDLFEYIGRQIKVYESLVTDKQIMCTTLGGEFICNAVGDYFKETGRLSADIGRLESARKTLTQLAEQGSGEVRAAPEYETMIDVASRTYARDELYEVDKFISVSESELNEDADDSVKLAAGAETIQKARLINPLMREN